MPYFLLGFRQMSPLKLHLKDQPEEEFPGDVLSGVEALEALGVKGIKVIVPKFEIMEVVVVIYYSFTNYVVITKAML